MSYQESRRCVASKPKRDYYTVLGVTAHARPTRTSRPPTASSPASITRTSIPATRSPSRSSRRSARPTRSCPIPTNARSTTAGATTGRRSTRPGRGANFGGQPVAHAATRGRPARTAARRGHGFNFDSEDLGGLFEQLFGRAIGRAHTRAHRAAPRHRHRAAGRDHASKRPSTAPAHVTRFSDTPDRRVAHRRGQDSAGATDGLRVRVAGKGEPGCSGGTAGRPVPDRHASSRTRCSSARATTCASRCPTPLYTAILGGEVHGADAEGHAPGAEGAARDGQRPAHAARPARACRA